MEKRVPVKLSDDQHKLIAEAAKSLGLSISGYLRVAALEKVKRDG